MEEMQNVRAYRKKYGYSAQQVAKAVNVTIGFYYNIENGKRHIGTNLARDLANFYGVSVDSILGRDPVKEMVTFSEPEVVDILSQIASMLNEAESKGVLTEAEKIDFFKNAYKELEFLLYRKTKK